MTRRSIAEMAEAELVAALTETDYHRSWALNVEGLPSDGVILCGVPLHGLRSAKGDIDIILFPRGNPAQACAVQVKKVKVDAEALNTGRPNNMGALRKAIGQTNLLASIGFHRIYLFVLVVVDAREKNAGRVGYDGLSRELDAVIRDWLRPDGLSPRAGLLHLEVVQSLDSGGPLDSGTSGVRLVQGSEAVAQPDDVTEWVRRVDVARRPTKA